VNTILDRFKTLLDALITAQASTYPEIEALNESNVIIGRIALNPKKYYNGMGILMSPAFERIAPGLLHQREDQLTIRFEVAAGENLSNPVVECADLAEDLKKYILATEVLSKANGETLGQRYEDDITVEYYVEDAADGNIMVAVMHAIYNWYEPIS
jgi:hypothetical protein